RAPGSGGIATTSFAGSRRRSPAVLAFAVHRGQGGYDVACFADEWAAVGAAAAVLERLERCREGGVGESVCELVDYVTGSAVRVADLCEKALGDLVRGGVVLPLVRFF